jgi:hypothetical protein
MIDQSIIQGLADDIRRLSSIYGVEYSAVLDAAGNTILLKQGTARNVDYSAEDEKIILDRGYAALHTHPCTTEVFSNLDIVHAFSYYATKNLKSVIVVNDDGYYQLNKTSRISDEKAEKMIREYLTVYATMHFFHENVYSTDPEFFSDLLNNILDDGDFEVSDSTVDYANRYGGEILSITALNHIVARSNGRVRLELHVSDAVKSRYAEVSGIGEVYYRYARKYIPSIRITKTPVGSHATQFYSQPVYNKSIVNIIGIQ